MASVLDLLQQFLCYGNDACVQEFNQYAYKPMEGIFYGVFFPIVFMIIFVYIVSTALSLKSNGIKILIAVALFAFVILQRMYYLFMVLGKLWMFVIVILGFFWVLVYTFKGKKQEAHGRTGGIGGTAIGGLAGHVLERMRKEYAGEIKGIELDLKRALAEVEMIEKAVDRGDKDAWRAINGAIARLHEMKDRYREILKGPGGRAYGGKIAHYEKEVDKALERLVAAQKRASR